AGDSREPELSGIKGALTGSLFTLLVTLLLSFPVAVAAAIYLEEFAPKNRWTDLVEVNINNLAAVPSIVFGLLGLAVFLNFFGMPRSSPLVGGMVLSLMTLPTIIIASRASLKAVPPSIREAALGVGASKMQTVFHHVIPLAMPGMMTGTIIGLSQALGETAPLLMIGMVAFIVDVPGSVTDPATVLPVQIFLWADSPERAFVERTSAAILVLLMFLISMNGVAIYLRRKFERRW
ncbi:MAG: phosphate ABC transporter permease PstA, partial [Candidatus Electrothrix sp. AX1]|nr:phosphate ABC transporter permease PstA [Candidatus Electrothrix sp. AX1]